MSTLADLDAEAKCLRCLTVSRFMDHTDENGDHERKLHEVSATKQQQLHGSEIEGD